MNSLPTLCALLISSTLFAQMPNNLSKTDKVYGLSKFWQEVNYNFVFFERIDKGIWDDEYKKLILEVQETQNDYEYYRLLQKFCALLKDGHTNVFFPNQIQESIYNTNFGAYRLFLTNIEGKAIITRVNLSKKEEIPIGTEIVKVNGLPTSVYQDRYVKPYISSSTDYVLNDWSIYYLLEGPVGSTFNLELKLPNGKMKTLELTHARTEEKEVFPALNKREILDFKWLKHRTAYIALNSFDDPEINRLFIEKLPELYRAKSLIIDLRNNDGGDTEIGLEILKYLTNDEVLYGSRSATRMHVPTFKAWGPFFSASDTVLGKPEWGLSKDIVTQSYLSTKDQCYYHFDYSPDSVNLSAKKVVVPTVLLIGHVTASAAEDFLIYTDNQQHMTKIGENTFGSTGQPLSFALPGEGSARVCTKKDTYPNGKEFIGYGIEPDIEISRTLTDYQSGNDPALLKAMEHLNGR